MRSRGLFAALAVGALLVLGGCGGDDDDGSSGDSTVGDGTTAEAGSLSGPETKAAVRTAQVGMEVLATDQAGSYEGATVESLQEIDPTTPDEIDVAVPSPMEYSVSMVADDGVTYTVTRGADSAVINSCEPTGEGDCPDSGEW